MVTYETMLHPGCIGRKFYRKAFVILTWQRRTIDLFLEVSVGSILLFCLVRVR